MAATTDVAMTGAGGVPATAGAVLTIDLDAIAANWRLLNAKAAPGSAAGVLKADGYGLGAVPVARALLAAGCRHFFVAHPDEALALRAALPDIEIGVLHGLMPGTAEILRRHRIIPVLNRLAEIEEWAALARAAGERLDAAIHLDTGMNRTGLEPREAERLAASPALLGPLRLRWWISHLATADDPGHPMTAAQAERFRAIVARLPAAPTSLANSSGLFRDAVRGFDLARPGAALYGINPTPEAANPMRPVVRLQARILQVRTVDTPGTVGYGAAHRVGRGAVIATIAAGYADGLKRCLGGIGTVLAGGVEAPVIGRISMDLVTVDVSGVPGAAVEPGRFVELIGPHRSVDAMAADAGTIGYEILTSLGRRYHRVYVGNGPSSGVAP